MTDLGKVHTYFQWFLVMLAMMLLLSLVWVLFLLDFFHYLK